jgi:hypothetical protein
MVAAGAEASMRLVSKMVLQVSFAPNGIIPARLAQMDRGHSAVFAAGIRGDQPYFFTT